MKNSEYNKGLHEFIATCAKALVNEGVTETLFADLLTRFERLVTHYENLQLENFEKQAAITEFGVLKYELHELIKRSENLASKI